MKFLCINIWNKQDREGNISTGYRLASEKMEEYLNFDRNDCLYLTNPLEAIHEYDETSKDDGWMYDHITYIEYETTHERRQSIMLQELLNRLRDMRIFLNSTALHFENIASLNKLPTVKNNILFGIQ